MINRWFIVPFEEKIKALQLSDLTWVSDCIKSLYISRKEEDMTQRYNSPT